MEADRAAKTTLSERYLVLYRKGDADGIRRREREPTRAVPELQLKVFDGRNAALGRMLLAWATKKETYLVVLDVAAITGKTGAAAQLKKRGFKVRRVQADEKLSDQSHVRSGPPRPHRTESGSGSP